MIKIPSAQFPVAAVLAALVFSWPVFSGCNPPVTLGVKSSSVPFQEVQSYLPLFEGSEAHLYQEIRRSDIGSQDLLHLLEEARERGIRTTLWPLLSMDQGPWANEGNADLFGSLVDDMMDWLEGEGFHPEWIAVNMENSAAQMDIIKEYFYNGDFQALVELLLGNMDRVRFDEAVVAYQQLVDRIQDRGCKVMVTTYPFMLEDFLDGDPDLQDLANVPLSGIDWDALTFTTYRTAYSGDLGVEFSPYMVYEYGRLARKLFGDKARLAAGMIGWTDHGPGYTSPEDLSLDIAAAKAAGIVEIDLFHLGGMIQEGGPAPWLDTGDTPSSLPPPDVKVGLARLLTATMDALLNMDRR